MAAKVAKTESETKRPEWLTDELDAEFKNMRITSVDLEGFGTINKPGCAYPSNPAFGWATVDGYGNLVGKPVTMGCYFPGDEKTASPITLGDFWKGVKIKDGDKEVTMLEYAQTHWDVSDKYNTRAEAIMDILKAFHSHLKEQDAHGDDESKFTEWSSGKYLVTDCPGYDLAELNHFRRAYGLSHHAPGYHMDFNRAGGKTKVDGEWVKDFRGCYSIHGKRTYLENPPATMVPMNLPYSHDPGQDAANVAWAFAAAIHAAHDIRYQLNEMGQEDLAKRIPFFLNGAS